MIQAEAENCVFALRAMAISQRTTEISRELGIAEQTGDKALLEKLSAEQIALARLKHELERMIKQD